VTDADVRGQPVPDIIGPTLQKGCFTMGLFDAIKGLLSGDGLTGVLESTGLGEHVEGLLGEGSALAENFGVDLGQATEALGLDGVTDVLPEVLPEGLGDIAAP
jgi:hypothetical protein